jgi:RNA polymerase sigma-70 factor (ECF subfamily)
MMKDMPQETPEATAAAMGRASDRSLLKRFQGGQTDAATQIYLRYAARLLALAAGQCGPALAPRVDPEDIVQSVFRTFFRRAAQGHYDVLQGEELWKLLLVIALHKIRSTATYHRAAKRDVRSTRTNSTGEMARELLAPDETALTTLQLVIDDLLNGLPATMKPIVELRIEGHEVHEIARQVQRSRRSVERALQEFRQKLSDLIYKDL